MNEELEDIKKEFRESADFIQDLAMDFTWIEWGEGSMKISSVPKGWEKIIRDLFECINNYSKFDRCWVKTDLKSRIWNKYCELGRAFFIKIENMFDPYAHIKKRQVAMIFREDRDKAKRTLKYKIQRKLQNFRWDHFVPKIERKYPPTLVIQQIKQKMGGLRVYVSGGDEIMRGMIIMSEHRASNTCEETGRTGKMCAKNGWYRILSNTKAKEMGYRLCK